MKLHELELVRKSGGEVVLTRTAVPGGWLYEGFAYLKRGENITDVQTTMAFVPDVREDRAEEIVNAVLQNLFADRRGFRQLWESTDPLTRAEIRADLIRVVKEQS